MRDCLVKQFDVSGLSRHIADVLEHAHNVARGVEVAIRIARVAEVRRELGEPSSIDQSDADSLLALAQSSSALLGNRLESLSQHESGESRRLLGNEQSSRGGA